MATEEKVAEMATDQLIEEVSNKSEMPATYEPPSPLTGCYLLIILGEPHSQQHKDIILQRLLKGLLSWNVLDCHVDVEEELNNLTSHGLEGEAARHGERLIQFASENLVTEILIHPQYNTLIQCMRNLLSSFTRHRHIIHSGYTFSGNGSWILQDATFSVSDFAEALQDYEVQRVIRAYPDTISMEIHCAAAGHWNKLPDKSYAKLCKIRINSVDILDSGSEKLNAFINYLSPMIVPANITELMESSDVVGNIRFSHPTLYVFPGGQGDAALFGINGFNMLVDGGFNRKSCFWDFTRHLDRLDAVLMTRINNANIQGLSSIIERKAISNVYPQIGYFFTNIPESKADASSESDKDSDPLLMNLFERGQTLNTNLKTINLKPQPCYKNVEPINLYHKVGHGTLDMYVISPSKESKEVREFLQKWQARDCNLFASKQSKEFQFPLQNLVSICAMLVWQPANPEETITRILFPGSTPDYKIIEGLDKMKHLEFVKHPICTANQIEASFSTTILTKKQQLKSALADKSITHEPILPSKVTKTIAIAPEKDNKMLSESVKAKQTDKESVGTVASDVDAKSVDLSKDDAKSAKTIDTEKDNKTVSESKPVVKSRIDSRPPKSMEKKLKKDSSTEKKSSPITTPKKEAKPKEKEVRSKVMLRVAKMSPSSTPAKSTKEANNRKVLESKQKTVKTVKKEASQTVEKKEIKEKVERKAISRRPKPAAGSPMKAVKSKASKDTAVRRPKVDKAPTSDSSTVSTTASVETKVVKTVEQDKQILLDDLIEEQEAVREIEAVLQRSEERHDAADVEHRAIIDKQDSTTEADEEEEYIIIEKEEQYTEDSVNEQESTQLTGQEEEIQKHQRDSQESEKKRKPSMETTEEEEPQQPAEKSTDAEQPAVETAPTEGEPAETKEEEEKEEVAHKMNGHIPQPKIDVQEEVKLSDEASPDADEKVSSDEKKGDAKEDSAIEKGDIKETDIVNPPESQATAESGATTAPTLPEDEHITLDEIKEDVVIEEKYIKEETKEAQVIVASATVDEKVERLQPKPMHFESQQPHLRELNIKTPDEVADLPVHEEADMAVDETAAAGSRKASLAKADAVAVKTETVKVEEKIVEKESTIETVTETKVATPDEEPKSKSPVEKKTPSPTGASGKKIDDSLTKIEPKIASPVEKIEYKVEELGQQFENTLKDVTGKVDLTEHAADTKTPSPIEAEKQEQKSPSPKPKDDDDVQKSVSPEVDITKEEITSTVIETETKVEVKTANGDLKHAEKSDSPVELERKDSVVSDKMQSKTPSPEVKESIETIEKIETEEEISKEHIETVVSEPQIKTVDKVSSEITVSQVKETKADDVVTETEIEIETTKTEEKTVKEEVSVETIEKTASKSPSPELKESEVAKDGAKSVSPPAKDHEQLVELERKESIASEKAKSKTPSPDLKATEVIEETSTVVVQQTTETTVDKSKSPSPTKDEQISESRKQSMAEKESGDEIERKSASPVEKEAIASPPKSVSPTKDLPSLPLRKDSAGTDDQPKSGSFDQSSPYTEVYDYSHPFDPQLQQELRETHITTVESPIVEKSKLIDLQVIDKTITETSERDDSILNDIKEEEDEDRISPPREVVKDIPGLDVQIEPPRSVSPREQEVLKIVANVAEVLKSEKDITDIIPDFNEDELEKHILQRASTPEVFSSIDASSRKQSIDPHDLSASLSEAKTSTTSIDEKEQHEIAEKHQAIFHIGDSIERKESFMSGDLDDSRRESAISTFSERDYTKDESTLDRFSRSNSPVDLKHDDLDVKSIEIETHSEDITEIEKSHLHEADQTGKSSASPDEEKEEKERKQSTTTEVTVESEEISTAKTEEDTPAVHRMLVTASSEDGGEETEICAKGTIKFSPTATTPDILSGKATPDVAHDDLYKKTTLTKEAVDDLQHRELATSRTSDRPESVMSHFSDTTEPELKETCSSPEKQLQEKVDEKSSGKSTGSSSSHGSIEIEGIKTSSDEKEEATTPKTDGKKSAEPITVKSESRADSVASDAKVSPPAEAEKKEPSKPEESGKSTPVAVSRPESSASDKNVEVEATKTPSPPIDSGKKEGEKSPVAAEKEEKTVESRSQSAASVEVVEVVEVEEAQKSRSQSIVSEKQEIVSGKATPADASRPESSASGKQVDAHASKSPSPPAEVAKKDSVDKVDDRKLSTIEAARPESVASDASAKSDAKSPSPSLKEEKTEVKSESKSESRSQSVASVVEEQTIEIEETQKSLSQSIVSEKQEIVSGKVTPSDKSRPESSASDKQIDASKSPSSPVEVAKKESIEKIDDRKSSTSDAVRPESVASDISAKGDGKSPTPSVDKVETKPESRSQSVASVISEEKVDIEKEAQKSRSQSIVSEKQDSGKATPADASRPESSASDKKSDEIIAKSPSPPAESVKRDSMSAETEIKQESRSQSIASVTTVEKVDETKSRSQSIVSEKGEIVSGKATPTDKSRPESSASDKQSATKSPSPVPESDEKQTADDAKKLDEKSASRPESSASNADVKHEHKSPSPSAATDEKIDSRKSSVAGDKAGDSRPESRESVDKVDAAQKSRSQSIVSEKQEIISGKATPTDKSRPESSASDKKDKDSKSPSPLGEVQKSPSPPAKDDQKPASPPDSRRESAASHVTDTAETAVKTEAHSVSMISTTTEKIESRPESRESVDKVDATQKSRTQSITSEKPDASGKATPADVSRPESNASDKKSDDDTPKAALKADTSRPQSQASDVSSKDGHKSPAQEPTKPESRSQSAASVISEEKVEVLDAQKSRSQSIVSEKHEVSGKTTPASVSRPESSASDEKDDVKKSPTPSIESQGDKVVQKSPTPPPAASDDKTKTATETLIEKTTSIVQSISETISGTDHTKHDKDKDEGGSDTDLIGMQIATGSTIHGVCDSSAEKAVDHTDDKRAIDGKSVESKKPDPTTILKESRSKSVASISVFEKPSAGIELEKIVEASKDDLNLGATSQKPLTTLIEDVKKIDERIGSKPSDSEIVKTIETTTTITKDGDGNVSMVEHKLSEQKSEHSSLESTTSDKGSIETVLDGGALSSFSTKEPSLEQIAGIATETPSTGQTQSKITTTTTTTTVKTEAKTHRDSDNESDDEGVTSSQKYSYEDYQLERSNSELSKKSDLDIDDSQNDIPPQYGSQEFKSAKTVSTSAFNPMSTSIYGELPTEMEVTTGPVTVTTVRTIITKQQDDSAPTTQTFTETYTTKADGDTKFLEEADLGFEKALEEHRQARGSEVMSSITSKYEFSPSKSSSQIVQLEEMASGATAASASAAEKFPLTDVKPAAKEQPTTETILSAEALARQLEEDLKKAEERVASWGKPLGLPVSINENPPTPKKERKIASAKIKLNNEKNTQRRIGAAGKKITPIYMDLTYVPHNGNSYYSHVEFFKRVRARYYVFSGTEPSRDVYNALLEAKQTWEDQSLEVTIIPTYDTDVLGYWVAENEEMLAKYHIDLSPSASRCTINLQDHETCCSAYRLEF